MKIAQQTGLGRDAVRLIGVDHDLRMDLDELTEHIGQDHRDGRCPFLVVATAGTTAGGVIDPVADIIDIGHRNNMHVHVDAAWAGAIAVSPRLRPLLGAVEDADSITVDAHKWMSAPMGAGMFLTPHGDALARSFRVAASYMPSPVMGTAADPYTHSMQVIRACITSHRTTESDVLRLVELLNAARDERG